MSRLYLYNSSHLFELGWGAETLATRKKKAGYPTGLVPFDLVLDSSRLR